MTPIVVTRSINAPLDRVFNAVAGIQQFSQANPRILKYEILSAVKSGVGTRFRETRVFNKREVTTELEVKEYVLNDHIRIVADSNGTVWDSVFTVKPEKEHTALTVVMEAKAYKLIPKMMNLLIRNMVARSVAEDMDSVKAFCEK